MVARFLVRGTPRSGMSVIEVIVAVIILVLGIVGAYGLLDAGGRLATTTENRIKAVNIAREGLEVVENIRNTNWLKFASNYQNCWRVKDYNSTCLTNATLGFVDGSYTAYLSGNLWYLSGTITPSASFVPYKNQFPVFLSGSGLITQSGSASLPICAEAVQSNCRTIFSREIKLTNANADTLEVESIVQWADNTRQGEGAREVRLSLTLTNWQKDR